MVKLLVLPRHSFIIKAEDFVVLLTILDFLIYIAVGSSLLENATSQEIANSSLWSPILAACVLIVALLIFILTRITATNQYLVVGYALPVLLVSNIACTMCLSLARSAVPQIATQLVVLVFVLTGYSYLFLLGLCTFAIVVGFTCMVLIADAVAPDKPIALLALDTGAYVINIVTGSVVFFCIYHLGILILQYKNQQGKQHDEFSDLLLLEELFTRAINYANIQPNYSADDLLGEVASAEGGTERQDSVKHDRLVRATEEQVSPPEPSVAESVVPAVLPEEETNVERRRISGSMKLKSNGRDYTASHEVHGVKNKKKIAFDTSIYLEDSSKQSFEEVKRETLERDVNLGLSSQKNVSLMQEEMHRSSPRLKYSYRIARKIQRESITPEYIQTDKAGVNKLGCSVAMPNQFSSPAVTSSGMHDSGFSVKSKLGTMETDKKKKIRKGKMLDCNSPKPLKRGRFIQLRMLGRISDSRRNNASIGRKSSNPGRGRTNNKDWSSKKHCSAYSKCRFSVSYQSKKRSCLFNDLRSNSREAKESFSASIIHGKIATTLEPNGSVAHEFDVEKIHGLAGRRLENPTNRLPNPRLPLNGLFVKKEVIKLTKSIREEQHGRCITEGPYPSSIVPRKLSGDARKEAIIEGKVMDQAIQEFELPPATHQFRDEALHKAKKAKIYKHIGVDKPQSHKSLSAALASSWPNMRGGVGYANEVCTVRELTYIRIVGRDQLNKQDYAARSPLLKKILSWVPKWVFESVEVKNRLRDKWKEQRDVMSYATWDQEVTFPTTSIWVIFSDERIETWYVQWMTAFNNRYYRAVGNSFYLLCACSLLLELLTRARAILSLGMDISQVSTFTITLITARFAAQIVLDLAILIYFLRFELKRNITQRTHRIMLLLSLTQCAFTIFDLAYGMNVTQEESTLQSSYYPLANATGCLMQVAILMVVRLPTLVTIHCIYFLSYAILFGALKWNNVGVWDFFLHFALASFLVVSFTLLFSRNLEINRRQVFITYVLPYILYLEEAVCFLCDDPEVAEKVHGESHSRLSGTRTSKRTSVYSSLHSKDSYLAASRRVLFEYTLLDSIGFLRAQHSVSEKEDQ